MAKTVKELAQLSNTNVETILKQLSDAGLPARGEADAVSEAEQEKLVAFLKQSHGEKPKSRISLKSKTTSTAQVTGTSGKAKTVNVVRTKKSRVRKARSSQNRSRNRCSSTCSRRSSSKRSAS